MYLICLESPAVDGSTTFSLTSTTRDADPPVFTLTFNVTTGSPLSVICTVGNSTFDINGTDLRREVINAIDPIQVSVTATHRTREPGSYQCQVSGAPELTHAYTVPLIITGKINLITADSNSIIIFFLIVTGTPTNLTVMRTSFDQAVLSWSAPASNDPIVQGYEVFYDLPNGTRLSEDTGNNSFLVLVNLEPQLTYPAFIVAYGGDLASEASSINISESKRLFEG